MLTPRRELDVVGLQRSSQWLWIVSFRSPLSILLFPVTEHLSTLAVAFEDDDDRGDDAVHETMTSLNFILKSLIVAVEDWKPDFYGNVSGISSRVQLLVLEYRYYR